MKCLKTFHIDGEIVSLQKVPNKNVGATIGRPQGLAVLGSQRAGNARPYIECYGIA